MNELILEIIKNQIQVIFKNQNKALDTQITNESELFGSQSLLDSLDLINLIVGIESEVQKQTGKTISLADDRALEQETSPFETVGSLHTYILMLIN